MARVIPVPVDVADNATVVTTARVKLHGIYVTTALSAHACPIENAAGTTVFTLPASAPLGGYYPFHGAEMAGITVNPNDAGTGNITLVIEHVSGPMSDPVA